jgi:uncharacterized protein
MIRRLKLDLPAANGVKDTNRPLRLLAISDEKSPTLEFERNRLELQPINAVLGCGDLEPDYLAFLADAFNAPLYYVRGNHDRDAGWTIGSERIPHPLEDHFEHLDGVTIAGLSWPGKDRGRAERDGTAAWWQAATTVAKSKIWRQHPDIILSHVPPRGLGDAPEDEYHRGFSGYHWLCRTLSPRLWLHGHTTTASVDQWRTTWGDTLLVNVTGGVLIEIGAGPVYVP